MVPDSRAVRQTLNKAFLRRSIEVVLSSLPLQPVLLHIFIVSDKMIII